MARHCRSRWCDYAHLQYRYATILEQDVYVRLRLMRDRLDMRVDTIINQPDSVLVREERRHARQRDHGYGVRGALALTLPNERDLLADEFLQDHCLAAPVVGEDGSIGVVFRPVRPRADRVDIRGTIWLAPVSFQIRRLPLADSVILATALAYGATLWTQDADFEGLPGVQYQARPRA
jgi:hypothetical protein